MTSPPGPLAERVARLARGEDDPALIARVDGGWAVLNRAAPAALRGSCMLLPERVVPSPNDLDAGARARWSAALLRLGDAILAVTGAERINYLVLCNQLPELHGHCIPRFATEDPALRRLGPFEAYAFADPPSPRPDDAERALIAALRAALHAPDAARG